MDMENKTEAKDEQDGLLGLLVAPVQDENNPEGNLYGNGEGSGETGKPGEAKAEPYSAEEFSEILEKNPLDVEPERVPAELMPAYKAAIRAYKNFQAGFTRKTQELKEQNKPKDIYEAYDLDPDGVSRYLDSAIVKAKEEGDVDQVSTLLTLKANLLERKLRKVEKKTTTESKLQEAISIIRKEIPDIEQKAPALTEFAINHLGLTEQEVSYLTDPKVTGELAIKLTLAVNRAYEMANIDKTLNKKAVKQTPLKLGSSSVTAGSGIDSIPPGTIANMSLDDFEKLVRKVKSTKRG